MIRNEIRYRGKFALKAAGKRQPKGAYFKVKWEDARGEGGVEWTRMLCEAYPFMTYRHAHRMYEHLKAEGVLTWIVSVKEERRRGR